MTRCLAMILVAVALGWPTPTAAKPQLVDRIVAVVDNQIILHSEIMTQMAFAVMEQGMDPQTLTKERREGLYQTILENMIQNELLLARAKEDSIEVDAELVEEEVRARIRELKTQHGEAEFQAQLQSEGLTEREVREQFRQRMREAYLRQQMSQRMSQDVQVSYGDIQEFRDKYQDTLPPLMGIGHILIEPKPSADLKGDARGRAEALLARIREGEDFAELARQHSDHPESAAAGGDVGILTRGSFLPELEDMVFSLKPGEVSNLLETDAGYFIIRVDDVDGERVRARIILISLQANEADTAVAYQEAMKLYNQIQDGADFAEMAKAHSAHKESAVQGGRLPGLWTPDNLPPGFADVIRAMRLGDVSQPVQSEFGWHLVKLNDDRDTLEEVVQRLRLQDRFRDILEETRKKLYVDIRPVEP